MIRFLQDVSGGATSITAAMLAVMAVGGTALISDHVWLVDQRDVLKSAADAAAAAATLERNRLPDGLSDRKLNKKLRATAERYVKLNLAHLPKDRYERAVETLVVNVFPNRHQGHGRGDGRGGLGRHLVGESSPALRRLAPIQSTDEASKPVSSNCTGEPVRPRAGDRRTSTSMNTETEWTPDSERTTAKSAHWKSCKRGGASGRRHFRRTSLVIPWSNVVNDTAVAQWCRGTTRWPATS